MRYHFKTTNKLQMGLFEQAISRRTKRNTFFTAMDQIIDWAVIEKELIKITKRGLCSRGQKAHNPLVLFKMQLVAIWYNLSDQRTEEMVYENLVVMDFCGLSLEDAVPDHSTLSRFRSELCEKKAYDRLLRKINKQLKSHKLILTNGHAKIDASLTESPYRPKGSPTYEIAQDRQEEDRDPDQFEKEQDDQRLKKLSSLGMDDQARWLKKGKKTIYGYKKHIATDDNGVILSVHSTPANEHDSKGLIPLIRKTPKSQRKQVFTDKGYRSQGNIEFLSSKGSSSRIMYKAYRNTPLTKREELANRLISKTRWVVERTFGSLKRWFGSGVTRLKGLTKVHGLHVIESIAHNLKRAPGLVCAMAK